MKANSSLDDDKALSSLLKEWKVEAPLPPGFQEQVWRRIEREEEPRTVRALSPWAVVQNWMANILPRPALAVAYVGILLAAGAGIGWTQGQIEAQRISEQLSASYVKSVDPYLASR
jgi:hypothetical protein